VPVMTVSTWTGVGCAGDATAVVRFTTFMNPEFLTLR
jgi:hypothetical protein